MSDEPRQQSAESLPVPETVAEMIEGRSVSIVGYQPLEFAPADPFDAVYGPAAPAAPTTPAAPTAPPQMNSTSTETPAQSDE